MQTTTFTELRKNLSSMMDKVNEDHVPLVITRGNNSPAVLISLEDYNSYAETFYLMSSKENAKRLRKAVKNVREGKFTERELIED